MFKSFSLLKLNLQDTDKAFLSAESLDTLLRPQAIKPIGNQEVITVGWSDFAGKTTGSMALQVGKHILIAAKIIERILPGSVINQYLAEEVEKLTNQGMAPGRKQIRELKDNIRERLIPKAFVKERLIHGWLDTEQGWLIAESKADLLAELLHKIGNIKLELPNTKTSPTALMTNWLLEDAVTPFTVDDECELKSFDEQKPTVKYSRLDLDREDVRKHIEEGKVPVRLAMTYDDAVSFVLTEKLEFKKVSLIDQKAEDDQDQGDMDEEDRIRAEFALVSLSCQPMISALMAELQ